MSSRPTGPGSSSDALERELVWLHDPEHELSAAFAPRLGMIGASLLHRGEELLGQRRGLAAYRDSGKTMGLPFLYPWANRLRGLGYTFAGTRVELDPDARGVRLDPNGLPIHGLLAASPDWVFNESSVRDEPRRALRASFDFGAHPELLASFPFPHRVDLAIALEQGRLAVTTTVTPTADRAVPLAFGFHPYLTLPGVPRHAWQVDWSALRHRLVDDRGLPTGDTQPALAEHGPLGSRTFDDGYDEVPPGATFAVSGGGRRIEVRFDEGYPAAQIFAPGGDEALICFEPMASPTDALGSGVDLRSAPPGTSFTARFSIAVRPSS